MYHPTTNSLSSSSPSHCHFHSSYTRIMNRCILLSLILLLSLTNVQSQSDPISAIQSELASFSNNAALTETKTLTPSNGGRIPLQAWKIPVPTTQQTTL